MNPKRWRWYTWVSIILYVFYLWATQRVTGRIDGISAAEAALFPGMFWLFWFLLTKASALNDRYYNRRKAKAAAQQQEPTPQ